MSITVSDDIDTFLKAADQAAARAALALPGGTTQWPLDDTRPMRVGTVEAGSVASGEVINLLTVAGGTAGTVTLIQLALGLPGSDTAIYGSELRIMANGADSPGENAPLGTFFMVAGKNTGFHTDWIGTGNPTDDATIAAFRAVEIPFTDGIVIDLYNAAGAAASVFSQVIWREGTDPLIAAGISQRQHWHCARTNAQSVAHYDSLDLLPQVTGPGEIEAVIFFPQSTPNYYYLEGNPVWTIDAATQGWGGTEDYFGGQYYFHAGTAGFAGNPWGGMFGAQIPTAPGCSAMLYRKHFPYARIPFTTAAKLTWTNGDAAIGDPGDVVADALVSYWTRD